MTGGVLGVDTAGNANFSGDVSGATITGSSFGGSGTSGAPYRIKTTSDLVCHAGTWATLNGSYNSTMLTTTGTVTLLTSNYIVAPDYGGTSYDAQRLRHKDQPFEFSIDFRAPAGVWWAVYYQYDAEGINTTTDRVDWNSSTSDDTEWSSTVVLRARAATWNTIRFRLDVSGTYAQFVNIRNFSIYLPNTGDVDGDARVLT